MNLTLQILGLVSSLMLTASGLLPLVLIFLFVVKTDTAKKYWVKILLSALALFIIGLVGIFVTMGFYISNSPDIKNYINEQTQNILENVAEEQEAIENETSETTVDEVSEEENSNTEEAAYNADDTFKEYPELNSFHGLVSLKGYLTIEPGTDGYCEVNCEIFNYVQFNILENSNADLLKFMKNGQDNPEYIKLGCLSSGIIKRFNDSDEFGMAEYTTNAADTARLLKSSETNPITIQLERFKYTSGRGAPTCYSHYANIYLK
jgi:hypothetical protein